MDHTTGILLGLFITFIAAQAGAELAQRMRLPSVVGEIAAGCIVGPSVLGWVQVTEPLQVLSSLGVVLLLFAVGLETRLADLNRVGSVAISVGSIGVVVPFALGAAWARLSGFDTPHSVFVAAAFVATSAGITARVLQELGVMGRVESRVILGAAVIDDILAMLLIGVVTSIQDGHSIHYARLAVILVQAAVFVLLVAVVGTRVARRASPLLDAPINPLSPLTLSLALCLGLAAASEYLGLAAIIGAFLAGVVLAETPHQDQLTRHVQVIAAFLTPFFFVVTGAMVDLHALASWSAISMLIGVTILAVLGKILGCGLGALSLGRKSALIVGVGMVPRGEVGIIVASLGLQAGVFSGTIYGVIIAMALLTSILAPPMLKVLLSGASEGRKRNSGATEPR